MRIIGCLELFNPETFFYTCKTNFFLHGNVDCFKDVQIFAQCRVTFFHVALSCASDVESLTPTS